MGLIKQPVTFHLGNYYDADKNIVSPNTIMAVLNNIQAEYDELRYIVSYIPGRVVIEAKEKAGRGTPIKCMARPSTGRPDVPTEYRCNICGGLVHFDGTPPASDYSPARGGKR